MSTISSGTTLTTGYVVTSDTTGTLVFQVNGTTTAATLSATGNLTLNTGNLTFGGTAQRITGDFSNATVANRLLFQTSTANTFTDVAAIPNGTGTLAQVSAVSNSDPTNGSIAALRVTDATDVRLISTRNGSGTFLPMTFYTNGSERVRIDTSGNVGIGGTAAIAFVKCQINGTLPTSGTLSIGFSQDAAIPSGTTALYAGFNSAAGTQAASFTLTSYAHYRASQGTFGAGSAVTNQFGYLAESTITGATNNYGFYGNIASGSNRWNFYAAGTAQNYFAGNTLIGTTADLGAGARLNIESAQNEADLITLRYANAASGKYWRLAIDSNNVFYILNQGGTGVYLTDGATSWTGTSDERTKTDLRPIENAASKVATLRAVTGRFKHDEESVSRAFLIAQDVQKILPEAVTVQSDEQGTLGLAYTDVIPLLVAAIKEQQTMINELKAKVAALEAK